MFTRRSSLSGILVAAMVFAAVTFAVSQNNITVIPPQAKPFGLSYSQWSVKWWQWAYSMPVDAHPLFDTADVDAGQSGPVWFLGGTFGSVEENGIFVGRAERDVTIPVGTALFFPILNAEGATVEGNGTGYDELSAFPIWAMAHAQDLECTIDGAPVGNLDRFNVLSPLFQYGPLPANNAVEYFGYDAPEGTVSDCVSGGYFIMLAPLSKGPHTLHFTGRLVFTLDEDGFDYVFLEDITYHLNVVPRNP